MSDFTRKGSVIPVVLSLLLWLTNVNSGSRFDCTLGNDNHLKDIIKLDADKFSGKWYSHYIIPKNLTDEYTCWVNRYIILSGNLMAHAGEAYMKSKLKRDHFNGTGYIKKNEIHRIFPDYEKYNGIYYVIATDYTQFAIEGGCPPGLKKGIAIWIEFRSKHPSKSALDAAVEALKKQGLKLSDFQHFCEDNSQYNES